MTRYFFARSFVAITLRVMSPNSRDVTNQLKAHHAERDGYVAERDGYRGGIAWMPS
jgi:hypothetical protein